MRKASGKQLQYLEFISRENEIRLHRYDEEMLQYQLLKNGNGHAVEESERLSREGHTGHIFDDPVKNQLYLCIASATTAARFCIEGGLEPETAGNISALFLQKFDACHSVEELLQAHKEMFEFFLEKMQGVKKSPLVSLKVQKTMDYIYYHLNERITVKDLAENVALSPAYLSLVFARETGVPISQYVIDRRVEAGRNMLIYSDYSVSEIADMLAFSSQSHFSKIFKEETGITPREYRKRYSRKEAPDKAANDAAETEKGMAE